VTLVYDTFLFELEPHEPLLRVGTWLCRPRDTHHGADGAMASATSHGAAVSPTAAAGGTNGDDAQAAPAPAEVPLIAEASLQVGLGEGVHLIPGLVMARQQGRTSTTLAARMQWFF